MVLNLVRIARLTALWILGSVKAAKGIPRCVRNTIAARISPKQPS